ncbi:MAG TPA: hypothetical protein VG938_07770 [Verrucomicrobiae bacterium]|jgi:hypothetical protein|nr:hypothetical protein [Verrucomicrobiae bacterium]
MGKSSSEGDKEYSGFVSCFSPNGSKPFGVLAWAMDTTNENFFPSNLISCDPLWQFAETEMNSNIVSASAGPTCAGSRRALYTKQHVCDAFTERRRYVNECGENHPFVLDWRWSGKSSVSRRRSTETEKV